MSQFFHSPWAVWAKKQSKIIIVKNCALIVRLNTLMILSPHSCVADVKGTSVVISCWWSVLPRFADFRNLVPRVLKLLSSRMLLLCLW